MSLFFENFQDTITFIIIILSFCGSAVEKEKYQSNRKKRLKLTIIIFSYYI